MTPASHTSLRVQLIGVCMVYALASTPRANHVRRCLSTVRGRRRRYKTVWARNLHEADVSAPEGPHTVATGGAQRNPWAASSQQPAPEGQRHVTVRVTPSPRRGDTGSRSCPRVARLLALHPWLQSDAPSGRARACCCRSADFCNGQKSSDPPTVLHQNARQRLPLLRAFATQAPFLPGSIPLRSPLGSLLPCPCRERVASVAA